MKNGNILILSIIILMGLMPAKAQTDKMSQYDITWTTQSKDSWESMPCGGGSLGLNVWVENNELYILMASPDSWTTLKQRFPGQNDAETPVNRQLVKLGRLHLKFSDPIFKNGFTQKLDLATNTVNITGVGENGAKSAIKIWVSVDSPVFFIDGESESPIKVEALLESWHGNTRFDKQSVMWSYRNDPSVLDARKYYIEHRKLESIADAVPDVLNNLTFGGSVSGSCFVKGSITETKIDTLKCKAHSIVTKNALKKFDLQTTILVKQTPTLAQWEKELKATEKLQRKNKQKAWANLQKEWSNRWDKSYICINEGRGENDLGWQVGRNYQLFRAMLAANSKGKYPTMFNGGLFVCEANPDVRNWHWAEYMGQNQRLVYWPMLKSGDTDLLDIALNYYKDRTDVNEAWAKHFWGLKEGHFYVEDMSVFGLPCYMNTPDGHSEPTCLTYHYASGMEFALMMLERARFTGEDVTPYIKSVAGILKGFDGYYRLKNKELTGRELNQRGQYEFYPASGLELYTDCRNDVASITGLMSLADGLMALPESVFGGKDREFVRDFRMRLPIVNKRVTNGHLTISPAQSWVGERSHSNMEYPHLYPVFPFGYYGVGKPDLQLARDTWEYAYFISPEYQKRTFCWYQGNIFTARLGLTDEAKYYAEAKFLYPIKEDEYVAKYEKINKELNVKLEKQWWDDNLRPQRTRYPAFFDTGLFCQSPDMDHGGSAMVGLQEMLLQTDMPSPDINGGEYGKNIYLLPAWPKDWDVRFKLHAPYQTTVECEVKDGKIIKLEVTPKEREKDIVRVGTFFE